MKIAIDCPFNADMLDHDLRHLGDLYKRLNDHGNHSRVETDADGRERLILREDHDQISALLTVLGLLQQIYDEVEARSPRPGKLYRDRF